MKPTDSERDEALQLLSVAKDAHQLHNTSQTRDALVERYSITGEVLALIGDYRFAARCFDDAIAVLQTRELGVNELFYYLVKVVKVFLREGRSKETVKYSLLALENFSFEKSSQDSLTAFSACCWCGELLMHMGKEKTVMEFFSLQYRHFHDLVEERPSPALLTACADARHILAAACEFDRNYPEAEQLYRQALELYEQAVTFNSSKITAENGDSWLRVADCHVSLGGVWEAMEDHEAALSEFEQALALNRKIVAADESNLTALKRLSSVCTHTANLYNALNRLPETLALFSEKADLNLLIARIRETSRCTEILFYTPPVTFPERMRMLIDEQEYSHVIGELTDTEESAYHLYYMMARVVEELARKYDSEELKNEAIRLMSSADLIADAFAQEIESTELSQHSLRIKSMLRRMKNQ